jgi:hypothetical protein
MALIKASILLAALILTQGETPKQPAIGMTASDVRASWGNPDRVSRQIVHRRYLEQWTFPKRGWCVEFSGSKGEEPRVRAVHDLSTLRR